MQASAIRIHAHGGPEVLEHETIEVGDPGPGEVRIRQSAVGLNFIDVYQRTGLYPTQLPATLGREAAGVIDACGARVQGFAPGDRVAYAHSVSGAYTQLRLMPAERVVKLPDTLSDREAAGVMLKGLTAQILLRRVIRVGKTDILVIHAAAGGVGSILVQWGKWLGARVVGIVSTAEKAEHVQSLGADHVLLTSVDLAAEILELSGGKGASIVYDSVGKDTFNASLGMLRPRGMLVSYGNASGPVPPVAPLELGRRGSLYLTRPMLFDYLVRSADLRRSAAELFDVITRGIVKVRIGQTYPLAATAVAHRDLEARRTTGSTVLLP